MSSSNLLSNPYVQDILAQPTALRDTLASLREPDSLQGLIDDLASGKLRRVVLTGMGASYHALAPLCLRLVQAGLPAQLVETSELLYYYPALLAPDSLLIVVSQSGGSAEIVHLLKTAAGRTPLIGVTNTPDSLLAHESSGVIVTSAGGEYSVACKTYIAALAALTWLGERFAQPGQDSARSWLEQAAESAQGYLAELPAHVASLGELLAGTRHLTFTGRGSSLAAVGVGALILKEAAHFPSDGMGSGAFRHGPLEATSPDRFVMVYAGPTDTVSLNESLFQEIVAIGGRAALIGPSSEVKALALPAVPAEVGPIVEILPAQMISIALAELSGHTAGRFRFTQKVITSE